MAKSPDFLSLDQKFMQRCLELAFRAEGRTAPNPLVGCVVVDIDGQVVGEGFHPQAGQSHAEVFALDQAGAAARGGTLYVSLEPCCHFGRTPPCSKRVIESGVARVVIGMGDPNPKVAGGGIKELQAAGIEVVTGILQEECRYQNRGFLKVIEQDLPWLALKMAVTLDGKIADRNGGSRYISGPQSRQLVMHLRSQYDAVFIGAATARLDDPSLTVRFEATEPSNLMSSNDDIHQPIRVILDSNLSLSRQARIFNAAEKPLETTTSKISVIIFCGHEAIKSLHTEADLFDFPDHVKIIAVDSLPKIRAEAFDNGAPGRHLDLVQCLKHLRKLGINKVLCEGGAALAGSLLDARLVDEIYWFIAAKILGDSHAPSAVASSQPHLISDLAYLTVLEQQILGPDIFVHGLIKRP